jgi:hypothetical protein
LDRCHFAAAGGEIPTNDFRGTRSVAIRSKIFFDNGAATGYDESQADPGEFSAERQSDVSIIYIGDERYEIFDAVIFGG